MNIGNMKVGPKLFLGFGIVLVLTAALGIIAFMQIGSMQEQSDLMGKAADLKTEMKVVRQQEKNYILRQDQASIDNTNDAISKVKSLTTELEAETQTVEGRGAIDDVKRTIPTYESAFIQLQALTKSKDADLAACEEHAREVEGEIKGSSADQATKDALMIELLTIRRTEKNYVARESENYVTEVADGVNRLKAEVDAASMAGTEKSAIKNVADTYHKGFSAYVSTTKDFNALQDTDGPLVLSGRAIDAAATVLLENAHAESAKAASTATMFVMAFILAAIAVGVGIALVVTKSIVGPVTEVVRVMKDFAIGKLDTRAKKKASGELLEMTNTMNQFGDDLQDIVKDVGNVSANMAAGNLSAEFTAEMPGEFNAIRDSLNGVTGSLKGLLEEAGMLAEAAVGGKLDTRGDVSKFKGGYAELVQGVNDTLDGVIGPLNVAAEYVDRISKGDIPEEITDEYKGDFNEIKNNLNTCIKAVNGLVAEAGMLAEAGVEGRLDTRGDAGKFGGDFARIVQGVNDTLDAVIGPLNVAAEYVDRISKGDIPEEITDEYKGDFKEIKNNLNTCIKAVNGLVAEAGMLAEAGVEGRLDTRGDAGKFGGDFARIVQGVNDTLDAVIGPLNVAAEYVDRISKGDIPEEITDEYKGDFNEIKNNLNTCIKAVNGLVAEANMLAEGAIEGKLDTRGDAGKFGGDFAKIVQGVNNMVDAVVEPIHEVTRLCDAFAEGDLSERIKIEAKGEFLELTETLNNFGDTLQTIINDIVNVAQNMAAGDLTAAFVAETPGEFNPIRDNLNQATDNLSDLIAELQGTVQNVTSIGKESAASVEQVNSGMQQISSASQQISKGAQETSSTVNESAKEVKETNAVLQQVQSNAEESNKFAVESAESAKEMNEMAMKSSEGMKEIQDAISDTVAIIKNLNSSLEQVGKTTEVIEGIAEQTNLLALNAAIEAARAGEHGRGFAVVAEEVRKLAENSKKSTGDIDTMITSLQEEMEKVVKATDAVTQRAEVGREDLEKAVAGVEKTAGMIEDIKNRMEQITEGARKGTESIGKVSKGVDEIASSAEESASSSEESSSAVEQQTAAVEQLSGGIQKLSEIAEQATEMIAKFKLKGGGESKRQEIASSEEE